jgi:hypothetical protein
LIFGGISKFLLWTDFGEFWQVWAEFGALAAIVLRACPKFGEI